MSTDHPSRHFLSVAIALTLFLPSLSFAESFSDWIDSHIDKGISEDAARAKGEAAVIAGATSGHSQQTSPALATNSSSLIDTTSATDFVSMALDLADLSGSSEDEGAEDSTSGSVTASGYAFYAAAVGANPLDQSVYCKDVAQWLRAVNGTVGFEDDNGDDRVILGGVKLVVPFFDLRNPCDDDAFDDLDPHIASAAATYASSVDQVSDGLRDAVVLQAQIAASPELTKAAAYDSGSFRNCLEMNVDAPGGSQCLTADASANAFFGWVRNVLGNEEVSRILEAALQAVVQAESELAKKIAAAIQERDAQPRLAIEFVTRQGDTIGDDYAVTGLLDWGMPSNPNLKGVLNFGWERKDRNSADNMEGGSVGIGFEYSIPSAALSLQRPPRIMLSADGKWMTDTDDIYRGQLRVTIPIPRTNGIELPISVSVANRSELIDETEVRGLVGFTVDTSRVFSALTGDASDVLSLLSSR